MPANVISASRKRMAGIDGDAKTAVKSLREKMSGLDFRELLEDPEAMQAALVNAVVQTTLPFLEKNKNNGAKESKVLVKAKKRGDRLSAKIDGEKVAEEASGDV